MPPIDQYDLMVVDECHRGYLLDREMSDAELGFRSQDDYVSKYRRVLEHFDAVKIGLTATPALHTVADLRRPDLHLLLPRGGDRWLPDRPRAARSRSRPRWPRRASPSRRASRWSCSTPQTGQIDLAHAPDEIRFEVEQFNKQVITVPFNRVVAEELAKHIDPSLPGKTLIFAATDAHADIVVDAAEEGLRDARTATIEDGGDPEDHRQRGRVGRLIRSFRNDAMPEDRRHRGPADDRHRRAVDHQPGLPAPGQQPHPL